MKRELENRLKNLIVEKPNSKLYKYLYKQLQDGDEENVKKVMIVCDKLIELDGTILKSKFDILVFTNYKGFPFFDRSFHLREIGEIFLKGILCNK